MELFTTVLLGLISIIVGVGLLIYGIRGRRESKARDARTYKRGRI
jgi:hypothetical protein